MSGTNTSESVVLEHSAPLAPPVTTSRLLSLDALRGFALAVSFFGEAIVPPLSKVPQSTIGDAVISQMTHVEWDGASLYDVGWPIFLCITGVSLSYSLDRRIKAGESKFSIVMGLIRKALFCVLFAFFLDGGFSVPIGKIYFEGIFFRYALTILLAGLAHLFLGFYGVAVLVGLLLVGYSSATLWGSYQWLGTFYQSPEANLDLLVQRALGSHFQMKYLWYFPRSLISCLAGLLVARIFQSSLASQRKVWWLVVLGVVTLNLAWMMDPYIQINKRLWTVSYTLCSFGVGCFFLAGFYQVIDVWGFRAFSMPWIVFGVNPLAAWAAHDLVPFDKYAQRLVGHAFEPVLGVYNGVLLALVQVFLCWLCFYWLYRRKFVFRIG